MTQYIFHCYNGTFFPCDNTDWHSTCHLHTAATILDSPLCLLDNQQADERSPYCEDSLVGSRTVAQGGEMTRSCPWRIEVWMAASASHALFTQTRHARSNFKALRMPWASTVGLLIGMWRNIEGGGEADWVRGERGGHESQVPQCQERSKHTCWLHTGIDKTLRESQHNKTGFFLLEFRELHFIIQQNNSLNHCFGGDFFCTSLFLYLKAQDTTERVQWGEDSEATGVNVENYIKLQPPSLKQQSSYVLWRICPGWTNFSCAPYCSHIVSCLLTRAVL